MRPGCTPTSTSATRWSGTGPAPTPVCSMMDLTKPCRFRRRSSRWTRPEHGKVDPTPLRSTSRIGFRPTPKTASRCLSSPWSARTSTTAPPAANPAPPTWSARGAANSSTTILFHTAMPLHKWRCSPPRKARVVSTTAVTARVKASTKRWSGWAPKIGATATLPFTVSPTRAPPRGKRPLRAVNT